MIVFSNSFKIFDASKFRLVAVKISRNQSCAQTFLILLNSKYYSRIPAYVLSVLKYMKGCSSGIVKIRQIPEILRLI